MVEKYTITKKDEVYSLLKEKRNFTFMDESLLKRLIVEMKIIRFTKKTLLIKQDEENRFIYIIIKGGVTVYVDKKPLYMLRRTGDVFGELSFVTRSPSTASIVAEEDTGVMAISFNYLKKLNSMEFGLWLCRVIGDKLIRTSKLKIAEGVLVDPKPTKPTKAAAKMPVEEKEREPDETMADSPADTPAPEDSNEAEADVEIEEVPMDPAIDDDQITN